MSPTRSAPVRSRWPRTRTPWPYPRPGQLHRRAEEGAGLGGRHPGAVVVVIHAPEEADVVALLAEGLGDADALNALVEVGVDVGQFDPDHLPGLADPAPQPGRQHDQRRQHHQRRRRQTRVQVEHHRHDPHQHEQVADGVDEAVLQQVLQGVDVVGQADEDLAHRPAVVKVETQPLDVGEQLPPHVVEHLLPHPRRQEDAAPGRQQARPR